MAVMDEALSRFDFCDPDRLGVLGGSYGGYMTSWIVGHTDRFKAAISERAVNNLLAEGGSSDIGICVQGLHRRSAGRGRRRRTCGCRPSTYAQNITTPLLILHSEDDLRCPIEQAEELFTVLRLLGRDVEFVALPAARATSCPARARRATACSASRSCSTGSTAI